VIITKQPKELELNPNSQSGEYSNKSGRIERHHHYIAILFDMREEN
jgi:hypothetical protein